MEQWTYSHDGGHRYGAMITNLSECFNSVLKGARSLPKTALVKFTFFKLVKDKHQTPQFKTITVKDKEDKQ